MPTRKAVATGDRFGRLVVLGQHGSETHCRRQVFICSCDCGVIVKVRRYHLVRGSSCSCGCARREASALAAKLACTIHGKTKTREYRIWAHMVDRCTKPGRCDADRYYNRGIEVFAGWVGPGGFERFFSYVGPSPTAQHSIDRIDNDSGYEPGNVRWATRREQARNRRSSRLITAFGKTQPLAAWAEEFGVKAPTISNRLALGWEPEEALTRPLQHGGRRK